MAKKELEVWRVDGWYKYQVTRKRLQKRQMTKGSRKDRANPKLRWKAVWGPIDLSSNLKENSSKDIKIYK